MSSYYDVEAQRYDATRGGDERAEAAAAAIAELVPLPFSGARLVDLAGGTGSITACLARNGWDAVVLDRSIGMLRVAAERLPGRTAVADATRVPLADASADLITTIWLLHLVPDVADAVVAEVARVVRPGGCWVTSVDKDRSHHRPPRTDADDSDRVVALADGLGMDLVERTSFIGATVWREPDDPPEQTFDLVAFRRRG